MKKKIIFIIFLAVIAFVSYLILNIDKKAQEITISSEVEYKINSRQYCDSIARKLEQDRMFVIVEHTDNLPKRYELAEYFGLNEDDCFDYKVVYPDGTIKEYIGYLDEFDEDLAVGYVSSDGKYANWLSNFKCSYKNDKIKFDYYDEENKCFIRNDDGEYKCYIENIRNINVD